jgi:predicted lipoprotein with Yx(FWY)xxD motif
MRIAAFSALVAAAMTLFGAGAALSSDAARADGAPARMQMTYDGPVLVDRAGMTLYSHANENTGSDRFRWQCTTALAKIPTDGSTEIGARPVIGANEKLQKPCVEKYLPYLAGPADKPVGPFSIVDRPGGEKQWAFRGFPVYTSVKDKKPGDRNGVGGFINGSGFVVGGRRNGFRLAVPASGLPVSIGVTRLEESLVLTAAANNRPLYAPKGRVQPNDDTFQPMLAPAIAHVSGDWSIIDAGTGRRQYAFKGKPLYAPPAGRNDFEIEKAGGWETVALLRSEGRPAAIGKHMSLWGDIYTDKAGRTLYLYGCTAASIGGPDNGGMSCDDPGDPAGYLVALCGSPQECARRWHPYLAPAGARPVGDWSVVETSYPMFTDPRGPLYPSDAPKVHAWAYRGRPVFTYYEDEKPGDIWGDMTKGLWGSYFSAIHVRGRDAILD